MTLRTLILGVLSWLFFVQCNTNQNSVSATTVPAETKSNSLFFQIAAKSLSIYGEWTYNFPFYSSELIINQDRTFKFHNRGCMGQGYTEGKWINDGNDFILTSFDKYKEEVKINVTEFKPEPLTKTKKIKTRKNGTLQLPTFDPTLLSNSVSFKFPDTSNVYFDKVKFKLQGDTLYKLDQNGLLTNNKFTMTKNNR